MFSRHNRMIGVFYLLADAALVLIGFWLAYLIRAHLGAARPLYPAYYYLWIAPVAVGISAGVGVATGVYREIREEELRRAFADPLKVGFISAALLFALSFAFQAEYVSRLLLGFYAVLDLLAMILFRLLARTLAGRVRHALTGYRHFLVVGRTPEALQIARAIEANEARGQRLDGFAVVHTAAPPDAPASTLGLGAQVDQSGLRRSYPVYALAEVPQLLRRDVIDEVIFAVPKDELDELEETFLACEEEGVRTRLLLSFFPHVISRVYLERLSEMPLLTFSATPENEYLLLLKRVLDFLMALALLVVLSPVLLILALLIKLTSAGPVLYRQTRCGLGGRKFTLYKFRSMRADAELRRQELVTLNEMDGPVFKITNDPRCTALGRFMRKFSLDELPQLFNIFKGDMSFVGPRPPLPEEVEKYEPWQRRRLRMQPGLTCLWALEGRSRLSFRRWMELDLEYIDHWSPSLDWKILLKTIPVVLLGRGAS
jgi:exopolysaccharide biosynthesis polyprenyl glycosylphosphotransferase